MATNNAKKKNLLSIGVTAVVALLCFYFGFNFLKGTNIFERTNAYYVTFDNLQSVARSTPVFMDGYRIGLIRDLEFDYKTLKGVTVELALDREVRIPVGSKVVIKTNPIRGAELSIAKPKSYSGFYNPHDTLPASSAGDLMSQVSDGLLPAVASLLSKMDTMLVNFDKLINNPHIHTSFREIAAASENLNASTLMMRQMMSSKVPGVLGQVEKMSLNLSALSEKLNAVGIDTTMMKMNQVIQHTELFTRRLTSKDNSMGLLLNDKSLYESLFRTSRSADSLMIDLKANPKRYVHFSLF